MILILVQTDDARAADQVVARADEVGGCRVVVLENAVVTRDAATPAPAGNGRGA